MSMVSGDSRRSWRVAREQNPVALEVVLLSRTYVLSWSQFLYAEGGEDEVRVAFATHDVMVRGAGLGALLADLAAQRVIGLDEPSRADKFAHGGQLIRELSVQKVGP